MRTIRTFSLIALALLFVAGSAAAQNNIAVTAPGLNGTNFALDVNFTAGDNTNAYVATTEPTSEQAVVIGFTADPTGLNLTTAQNGKFVIAMKAFKTAAGARQHMFVYFKQNNAGTAKRCVFGFRRNDGTFLFPGGFNCNGETDVEIHYDAGTCANDGTIRVFRNGTERLTTLNVNNICDYDVDEVRVGSTNQATLPNASGTARIDDFSIARQ